MFLNFTTIVSLSLCLILPPGPSSRQWTSLFNGKDLTGWKHVDPVPPKKFDFEPQRGRRPNTGYFGVQNHSDKDIVLFKEISFRYAK